MSFHDIQFATKNYQIIIANMLISTSQPPTKNMKSSVATRYIINYFQMKCYFLNN